MKRLRILIIVMAGLLATATAAQADQIGTALTGYEETPAAVSTTATGEFIRLYRCLVAWKLARPTRTYTRASRREARYAARSAPSANSVLVARRVWQLGRGSTSPTEKEKGTSFYISISLLVALLVLGLRSKPS